MAHCEIATHSATQSIEGSIKLLYNYFYSIVLRTLMSSFSIIAGFFASFTVWFVLNLLIGERKLTA